MVMPTSRVAPLLPNMEEAVGSPKDEQLTYFSDPILIPKDNNILSVEFVEKVKTAVEGKNWIEVVSIVKDIKQKVSISTVKIAVTGDSGNGMSSFINALRLIGHEEEDSAPTGVVRTTQKPAQYFSSKFPNVELWDLPGTGVTAQSMENYLEEMKLDTYDLVIIIASEQFSSNHVKLAKAMQRMRRKVYVVWTKLDRDLSSSPFAEPQLLQSIQKNIWENLQKEGVKEPPIFLVSNIDPLAHDFQKLREMLQEDIFNSREDGLLETLFHICENPINKKVETIKRSIDADTLSNDFRILDPDSPGECQKVFQQIFGVDDETLQQVALSMGQPAAYYMDARQSQVTQMYPQDGSTISWLYHSGTEILFIGFQYVYCCFDSRHYKHKQQKHILDEIAEETKKILRKILKDSIILP